MHIFLKRQKRIYIFHLHNLTLVHSTVQKIAERAPSFQSLVCVHRSVYCAHRPEQLDSRANYISREFKLNQTRTREKIEAKNSGMRGTYGADNWPTATGWSLL